ncbi:MAG: M18 family aminopeptidase [Treponema sp.]|uniref:M18 family aminopeptidase n=1 Tax=Treponema sp. TaxID=166 RepID=UPI0025E3DEBC|nr:M18 family aminopeptidase [Treponema sp.]MBQ8680655.1 M18 family aminopeptidase [Treponema sp.]
MSTVENLFSFIKKSPSPFHAVAEISNILKENGFAELSESEMWNLKKEGKYFVTRNSSSLIAFALPQNFSPKNGFLLTASHSDSPVFKIKENPEIASAGSLVLNVEKYGGMLIQPWFDRPLSVAGRVVVRKNENGKSFLRQILVNIDRNLLMIPNLAIHMNREANEGHKIDVQNEIRPVLTLNEKKNLFSLVAESAGLSESDIISHDLFLYNRSHPSLWGAENEFISSPKLDDLECAYSTLQGFLAATSKSISENPLPLYCLFDNEEVGSSSRQGADSTFLSDTLSRIAEKLDWTDEEYKIALSKSLMLSADNAHAVHPNYVSSADPVNRPKVNGGIVIKFNAAQKYTSDALSSAVFKEVCKKAGVPFQIYTNNSNVPGGSTLGNISQNHVSISCVDIGLAQWAMHSPYESAGAKDLDFMIRAVGEFYKGSVTVN